MSQTTVLAQVEILSGYQADPTSTAAIYPQMVNDLGIELYLTDAQVLTLSEAQYAVSLPSTMLVPLVFIYDSNQLDEMTLRDLESYDDEWRNRTGYPLAYTWEAQADKTVAIYPSPEVASPAISTPHSDPWNQDYLPYQALIIYSESRTNVLPYMELPLALDILKQEFSRESDHVNPQYAQAADGLSMMIWTLVSDKPMLNE